MNEEEVIQTLTDDEKKSKVALISHILLYDLVVKNRLKDYVKKEETSTISDSDIMTNEDIKTLIKE